MINSFKRLLPQSVFARAVGVLVGGTVGAQLVSILAAPFLTRIFTPAEWGLLAVFVGLLSISTTLACLRFEVAIALPESDEDSASLLVLSLGLAALIAIAAALLILGFSDAIAKALGAPALAEGLWLVPLGLFFGAAYNALSYWVLRRKQPGSVARAKVTQALATAGLQFALYKSGGMALLIAHVAGQALAFFMLARASSDRSAFSSVSLASVTSVISRYRKFPLISTWAAMLNTVGTQMAPLALAMMFGPAFAGLFSLTSRMLSAPITLIANAVSKIYLTAGAEANRKGELESLTRSLYEQLCSAALPAAVLTVLIAPDLFALVFGAEWRMAGVFAQWMAPAFFLKFCMTSLTVLIVLERQDLSLYLQALLFALRVAALAVGYQSGDVMVAISAFGAASALGYAVFLIAKLGLAGVSLPNALAHFCKRFALSILMALPIFLAHSGAVSGTSITYLAYMLTIVMLTGYYFVLSKKLWEKS